MGGVEGQPGRGEGDEVWDRGREQVMWGPLRYGKDFAFNSVWNEEQLEGF